MILDQLSNSQKYESLHPSLAKAFVFLRNATENPLPDGRQEIDGSAIYALMQSYHTAPSQDKKWESHRRYIDVQFVADGQETMYYAPLGTLQAKGEYLEEKDCAYYSDGPSTALRCTTGNFAVFYPEDLHKPGCELDGSSAVKKIVIKILL